MRHGWSCSMALLLLLTGSCGTPLPIDEDLCVQSAAMPAKAHFTTTKHQYLFRGTCHVARLRIDHPAGKPYFIPVTAPFTAEGYFEPQSGVATEIFTVPEPKMSEPSRPWGTFRSSFRCEKDPWLNDVTCEPITASANPPVSAYPGPRYEASRILLDHIFSNIPHFRKPYSSVAVHYASGHSEAVTKAWAAYRKSQQLARGAAQAPGSSYLAGLAPLIRSPVAGQRFLTNTAVPIKLGAPSGMNVGGYMVRIERKDSKGRWVDHTTLPVGPLAAGSAAGFTGFGAGVPPAGTTSPGAWRLSAQVSFPQQSGWSPWVEFVVMAPSTNKALQPPLRSFGR
jgi:hypothetical protein